MTLCCYSKWQLNVFYNRRCLVKKQQVMLVNLLTFVRNKWKSLHEKSVIEDHGRQSERDKWLVLNPHLVAHLVI